VLEQLWGHHDVFENCEPTRVTTPRARSSDDFLDRLDRLAHASAISRAFTERVPTSLLPQPLASCRPARASGKLAVVGLGLLDDARGLLEVRSMNRRQRGLGLRDRCVAIARAVAVVCRGRGPASSSRLGPPATLTSAA